MSNPQSVYVKVTSAFAVAGRIIVPKSVILVDYAFAKDLLRRGKVEVATEADIPPTELAEQQASTETSTLNPEIEALNEALNPIASDAQDAQDAPPVDAATIVPTDAASLDPASLDPAPPVVVAVDVQADKVVVEPPADAPKHTAATARQNRATASSNKPAP